MSNLKNENKLNYAFNEYKTANKDQINYNTLLHNRVHSQALDFFKKQSRQYSQNINKTITKSFPL